MNPATNVKEEAPARMDLRGRALSVPGSKKSYVIALDTEGTIVSIDPAEERLSSGKELVGRNYLDLLRNQPGSTPEGSGDLCDLVEKLLQGREARFSHERIKSDETGERRFRVIGSRVPDGDRPCALLFHEELIQEKDNGRILRLARFTIDQAADAIFWAAEDGHFEYVNEAACRLLGYSTGELLKMRVWDVYSGLTEATWQGRVAQVKRVVQREEAAECRHRDGRLIPVEVTVKYLQAEGKEFMCAYVRDTTSRKLLEDQFRQAQKLEAVGRLAGGIAHDFNNLLTVINGYSALLLDRLSPHSPDRSAMTEISQAGTRAAALTRQLLSFSRKQVIQPVVMDLNLILAGLGKLLTRLLGEDIEVSLRTDRDLGRIKADPGQIEQVLMNLSVNARDAMPGGGKLTLETLNIDVGDDAGEARLSLPKGRYVMLTVSDTGCGMDKETQSHLFEPFFTTKELGKGTGLGLSTVYGIVTRAAGRISCQSTVGKGTTFVLIFPRSEECDQAPVAPTHRTSTQGSESILLVEDDTTVRTLARVVLERYGYKVIEAWDGQEALKKMKDHPSRIDLLITDLVMPGMTGLKLIEEFSPRHLETKILIMSGYSHTGITDTDIRRKGLYYIQKPFVPETLAAKVRDILDRTAAQKPKAGS